MVGSVTGVIRCVSRDTCSSTLEWIDTPNLLMDRRWNGIPSPTLHFSIYGALPLLVDVSSRYLITLAIHIPDGLELDWTYSTAGKSAYSS